MSLGTWLGRLLGPDDALGVAIQGARHCACTLCPEPAIFLFPSPHGGLCPRCLNRVIWLGMLAIYAERDAVLSGGAAPVQSGPPGPYGFGKPNVLD